MSATPYSADDAPTLIALMLVQTLMLLDGVSFELHKQV